MSAVRRNQPSREDRRRWAARRAGAGRTIIEAAHGRPSELMRGADAIQRLVAERHGAFRARMGWSAAELHREFQILREEVEAAVRRRVSGMAAADPAAPERTVPIDEALALLARFAESAERASVEGYERALAEGRGADPRGSPD